MLILGDSLEKLKEIDEACDRGHEFSAYSQLGFSDEEIGEFYGYSPAVIAMVLAWANGGAIH